MYVPLSADSEYVSQGSVIDYSKYCCALSSVDAETEWYNCTPNIVDSEWYCAFHTYVHVA